MFCDWNLNLPFVDEDGSDSASDQHFILLGPPGQSGGLLGSGGSNSTAYLQPPQDPEKQQHWDPTPLQVLPSTISAEG